MAYVENKGMQFESTSIIHGDWLGFINSYSLNPTAHLSTIVCLSCLMAGIFALSYMAPRLHSPSYIVLRPNIYNVRLSSNSLH